jgi:hypothetical protein
MRVYRVTEYTPQPIGYKLVPFNGMRMQFEKHEPSSFLAVAKSKSELPKPPQGREQAIHFLGYASSVEAWHEKVAKRAQEERDAAEQRRRDRESRIIANLSAVGIDKDQAKLVALNVRLVYRKKGNFYCMGLLSAGAPTLADWLKERGYSGEQRASVERLLRSEEVKGA